MANELPIIDLSAYFASSSSTSEARHVAQDMYTAASTWGFFLVTGTTVSPETQSSLVDSAKAFFDLAPEVKMALDVRSGGVAWRGYMPLGGEHTHGRTDWKEGLYVGPEHADDHPLAGAPLHGRNQFPDESLPGMRPAVLEYVRQVSELGKTLTDLFSLGLGLEEGELRRRLLEPEPVVLFRCFKYVPVKKEVAESGEGGDGKESFGIGKHTGKLILRGMRLRHKLNTFADFGYLTILKVDSPGLQVSRTQDALKSFHS